MLRKCFFFLSIVIVTGTVTVTVTLTVTLIVTITYRIRVTIACSAGVDDYAVRLLKADVMFVFRKRDDGKLCISFTISRHNSNNFSIHSMAHQRDRPHHLSREGAEDPLDEESYL